MDADPPRSPFGAGFHPRLDRSIVGFYVVIKLGHPVYERIRAEWLAEEAAHEQDDFDAIDAMIDEMRERSLADDTLLEGPDGDDDE